MNGHNVFAGAFVDRSGHRRKDAAWLAEASASPEAQFAPVWHDRCLIAGDPPGIVLLDRRTAEPYASGNSTIFLGMFRNRPTFTLAMTTDEPPFDEQGQYHDLRYMGTVLPEDEANVVAHAIAMINWHRHHQFCNRCGAATAADPCGNTRTCSNPECGTQFFPRVDPAIIVLVSRGDRCLLGRQTSWPEGRYSTVAGFVEPGESLEDAVRREVFEESNILVGAVHYHSSQPWPFPSSLMLGFNATAESADIRLNDGELEDAQWFTRKQCQSGFPKLPFRLSIARRLVDNWLDED